MDRFVNDQNIARYRKLAANSTGGTERKILFDLLAEEKAKFIELQKARTTRPEHSCAKVIKVGVVDEAANRFL
jgi:hypothetical protein